MQSLWTRTLQAQGRSSCRCTLCNPPRSAVPRRVVTSLPGVGRKAAGFSDTVAALSGTVMAAALILDSGHKNVKRWRMDREILQTIAEVKMVDQEQRLRLQALGIAEEEVDRAFGEAEGRLGGRSEAVEAQADDAASRKRKRNGREAGAGVEGQHAGDAARARQKRWSLRDNLSTRRGLCPMQSSAAKTMQPRVAGQGAQHLKMKVSKQNVTHSEILEIPGQLSKLEERLDKGRRWFYDVDTTASDIAYLHGKFQRRRKWCTWFENRTIRMQVRVQRTQNLCEGDDAAPEMLSQLGSRLQAIQNAMGEMQASLAQLYELCSQGERTGLAEEAEPRLRSDEDQWQDEAAAWQDGESPTALDIDRSQRRHLKLPAPLLGRPPSVLWRQMSLYQTMRYQRRRMETAMATLVYQFMHYGIRESPENSVTLHNCSGESCTFDHSYLPRIAGKLETLRDVSRLTAGYHRYYKVQDMINTAEFVSFEPLDEGDLGGELDRRHHLHNEICRAFDDSRGSSDLMSNLCDLFMTNDTPPNIQTFNLLLINFTRLQLFDLVPNVVKAIQDSLISMNETTVAALLRYYLLRRDFPGYRDLRKRMEVRKGNGLLVCQPEHPEIWELAHNTPELLTQPRHRSNESMEEGQCHKTAPRHAIRTPHNEDILEAMILWSLELRNVKTALAQLRQLKSHGLEPTFDVINSFLMFAIRHRNWSLGVTTAQDALKQRDHIRPQQQRESLFLLMQLCRQCHSNVRGTSSRTQAREVQVMTRKINDFGLQTGLLKHPLSWRFFKLKDDAKGRTRSIWAMSQEIRRLEKPPLLLSFSRAGVFQETHDVLTDEDFSGLQAWNLEEFYSRRLTSLTARFVEMHGPVPMMTVPERIYYREAREALINDVEVDDTECAYVDLIDKVPADPASVSSETTPAHLRNSEHAENVIAEDEEACQHQVDKEHQEDLPSHDRPDNGNVGDPLSRSAITNRAGPKVTVLDQFDRGFDEDSPGVAEASPLPDPQPANLAIRLAQPRALLQRTRGKRYESQILLTAGGKTAYARASIELR